jgi:hypothetical protein
MGKNLDYSKKKYDTLRISSIQFTQEEFRKYGGTAGPASRPLS